MLALGKDIDFLTISKMTFEVSVRIYESMRNSSCGSAIEEVRALAVRYARIRTDWALADSEARRDMDSSRTRLHDRLIDAINILSREMARAGEDNGWRGELGNDRKYIGDFACHLHAILGVEAR